MSGGVFGWPDALKWQRNLWGNANFFNSIKLYKSEINLPYLIDKQFFEDINVSLNEIIDEFMEKLQDQLDKQNNSTDTETENTLKNLFDFQSFSSIFQRKLTTAPPTYLEDNYDNDSCDAYINTKIFGKVLNKLSCEDNDLFLGQFFSYAIISMPILIIGLLSFIFYIVFFFGCFCCCKAREKTCPGVVSIVFFGLITACTLIAVIFHIIGSVYIINIFNFYSSGQLFDEIEEIIDLFESTINKTISSINDEISSTLNRTSDDFSNFVDSLSPTITDSVNSTISNITNYIDFYKDLSVTGGKKLYEVKFVENSYNKNCAVLQNDICKINYIQKCVNLTKMVDAYKQVKEEINKMDISSQLSELMEPISEMLNSTFSDFFNQFNIENLSISDLGSIFDDLNNIRQVFDIKKYVQPWIILIAKILIFAVPILMLLVLFLQVLAFWTMNCCSRCIVGACFPCCFCSFCQTIWGIFTTSMCLFILIINILYYQGDDIINKFIERVTNENKTIQIRPLNFSGLTQNLISEITFDELELRNISTVKSIVDAKLNSSLSDLIGFEDLPIKNLAELINSTFSNSKESTNPGLIVNPLRDVVTNITNIIDENFNSTTIFDFDQLRDGLITYKKFSFDICSSKTNNCEYRFIGVNNSYELFISDMSIELDNIELVNNEVENNTQSSIQIINNTSADLLEELLKTIGLTFHDAIIIVESVLENVDAKFIIGFFNIIRVRFLYQLMGYCICVSISAHLYIIGMCAMTILLWIRRKGMASKEMQSTTEYSYSYSYSSSNSENKDNNKKKKKGKNLSEDENTSDVENIKNSDDEKDTNRFFFSDSDDRTNTIQRSVQNNKSNTASSINNKIFKDDKSSDNSRNIKLSDSDNEIINDSTENDHFINFKKHKFIYWDH